jgi:competence protein ComEC
MLLVEFWDVGQGDCSVIKLPSGEIILIDVGPQNSPIVDWLTTHGTVKIHSIILTHNDQDHAGAVEAVVDTCRGRIGTVYFLSDRKRIEMKYMVKRLAIALQKGEIGGLLRLEAPQEIWKDTTLLGLLEVKFPNIAQNILASNPNSTSAILNLSIAGNTKIIWTGDSKIESVAQVCSGTAPSHMTGPHHGAPEDRREKNAQKWLEQIKPQTAIISVGSDNGYDHPQVNYVRKLRKAKIGVLCTQLTPKCEKPSRLRHVTKSHGILAIPQPNTGYSCRGPIRLKLQNSNFQSDVKLDQDHAKAIRTLSRPKCLWP